MKQPIHRSHCMTKERSEIRAPAGTPRFYGVRECEGCGAEDIAHPAGKFTDIALAMPCVAVKRKRARMVAIVTEGMLQVHAAGDGVYASLCGLDGEDQAVQQAMAPLPKNARIDCPECRAMWQAWQRFKASDFTARTSGEAGTKEGG